VSVYPDPSIFVVRDIQGFDCILDQVDDDLDQLSPVANDHGQVRRQLNLQGDPVFSGRAAQCAKPVLDDRVEIYRR